MRISDWSSDVCSSDLFDLAAQDIPELGIGSGLSSAEIGARLRYEFVPEFAPYIGVEYERSFGDTARFARAAGEDVGGWSFLVGLRRSEEHTSELQSLMRTSYAVLRLKKKNTLSNK